MRHAFPLLLAILVLLAQTIALTHRTAHPNTGLRAPATMVATGADTTASVLDSLFGHADEKACADFDAALGLDINPGLYAHTVVAEAYTQAVPAALVQSPLARHPPGLFLARAPPRA